jgi:hypothetical protein
VREREREKYYFFDDDEKEKKKSIFFSFFDTRSGDVCALAHAAQPHPSTPRTTRLRLGTRASERVGAVQRERKRKKKRQKKKAKIIIFFFVFFFSLSVARWLGRCGPAQAHNRSEDEGKTSAGRKRNQPCD